MRIRIGPFSTGSSYLNDLAAIAAPVRGDERFVMHKPCLRTDSVARRPPLEKGGQGGYPRVTTGWYAVPGRLSSADLSHRPNILAMPFNPPCPPFSRGGRTDDAQQKHTS
jgi:hypothetical protein